MSYTDRLNEALQLVQSSVEQASEGGNLRYDLVFAMAALMFCLGQGGGSGGGGGGGSGASQAEIQAAIEAATNLASVSALLTEISTALENGTLTSAETTDAVKTALQTATTLSWFTPEIFPDILANLLTDHAKYSHGLNFTEYTAGFTTPLNGLKIGHLRVQYVSDDDPTNELTLSIGGANFAVLNPGGVVEIPKTFSDTGNLTGVLSNTSGNHRILVNLLLAI